MVETLTIKELVAIMASLSAIGEFMGNAQNSQDPAVRMAAKQCEAKLKLYEGDLRDTYFRLEKSLP